MRLRGDRLIQRAAGALLGTGFVLLGVFSALGRDASADAAGRDRAFWLGITLIIIGGIAVLASLTVQNLDRVWCRHPRRWGRPW